ncbi:hypothetical protein [Jeotgalibacillus proteolyticus]|uniref:DUF4064 domain-containing protein n=1 Tax=Jeotgalibacillus proteolyticus TaxID=2082395 RepID=A0A2S5GD28_9BACL|nr:hypothetical protein [Jeotgalibacillus proteolyticus]PPA70910.1 hypothetical protein C4B60_08980 [Jeotgalibacillus proteolyticus]
MKDNLVKTPKIIGFVSLLLLVMLIGSSALFAATLDTNSIVKGTIIEAFNQDPKVQRDTASGNMKVSPESFTNDTIDFLQKVSVYPLSLLGAALFLTLIGLITMKFNRGITAILFIIAGIASLFTLIPAILLFFAANKLFHKPEYTQPAVKKA